MQVFPLWCYASLNFSYLNQPESMNVRIGRNLLHRLQLQRQTQLTQAGDHKSLFTLMWMNFQEEQGEGMKRGVMQRQKETETRATDLKGTKTN